MGNCFSKEKTFQEKENTITPPNRASSAPEGAKEVPKKSWADIVSLNRAPKMSDISNPMKKKIMKARKLIEIIPPKTSPTAIYFRKIKRVQLGVVRKALRSLDLPPWAVLGLSFIGQSVLEVVCDERLASQLIVKLTLLGAAHIKDFDIFGDNLKKNPNTDTEEKLKANVEKVIYRLKKLISTSNNEAAKKWYSEKLSEAEKRLLEFSNSVSENTMVDVESEVEGVDNESSAPNTISGSKRRASSSPTTLRRVNFPKETPIRSRRTMVLRSDIQNPTPLDQQLTRQAHRKSE